MLAEDFKVCVKCKHYMKNTLSPYHIEHTCHKYGVLNPVTGVGLVGMVKCSEARSEAGHCMYTGRYWESKDGEAEEF